MNVSKMRYFEKVESPQQRDFLAAQNNCVLCGQTLQLHHMQGPDRSLIKEDAYCQNCDVKTRTKDYSVH